MKTRKTEPKKVIITTASEAKAYLMEYYKAVKAGQATSVKLRENGRNIHYASVRSMVDWFLKNKNQAVDRGWYGRSLNKDNSIRVQPMYIDDKETNLYRLGR